MLLVKSVIFLLISFLFISRIVDKYSEYIELGHTNILGIDWQGNYALIALAVVGILAGILFVMAIQNIFLFFKNRNTE